MIGSDFAERRWGFREALRGITERVAGAKGATSGRVAEVGWRARDGIEHLSFGVCCGDTFYQSSGVGMERILKKFMRCRALDNASGIHNVDGVATLVDDGKVVGDEDDGGA